MSEVRCLFDTLCEPNLVLSRYLASNADIVKYAWFEDACVKVIGGETRIGAKATTKVHSERK